MNTQASSSQLSGALPPGLAKPAQRALAGASIYNLQDLSQHSEAEIRHLHGIGPNALQKLYRALTENGLSFSDVERKQL